MKKITYLIISWLVNRVFDNLWREHRIVSDFVVLVSRAYVEVKPFSLREEIEGARPDVGSSHRHSVVQRSTLGIGIQVRVLIAVLAHLPGGNASLEASVA